MKAPIFSAYAKDKNSARAALSKLASIGLTPDQQAVFDKVQRDEQPLPCEYPTARELVKLGAIRPYWQRPHQDISCWYVPIAD